MSFSLPTDKRSDGRNNIFCWARSTKGVFDNGIDWFIGTLRNEDGSKDDGSCEKYYFSFSFPVLDHRSIFPFDFARDFWTVKGKRFSFEGKQRLSNFVVWPSRCSQNSKKWAFRGVWVKTTVSRRSARYIPTCNFCFQ